MDISWATFVNIRATFLPRTNGHTGHVQQRKFAQKPWICQSRYVQNLPNSYLGVPLIIAKVLQNLPMRIFLRIWSHCVRSMERPRLPTYLPTYSVRFNRCIGRQRAVAGKYRLPSVANLINIFHS